MAWERKMMRTVRVRNEHKLGTLARLMAAIASMNASVGTIDMITETAQSVVRDITVYADDAEHMDHVIEAMRTNQGTRVLEVRDEVLGSASKREDRHPLALTPLIRLPHCAACIRRVWPKSA